MKVVIDTNVFVSAFLSKKGTEARILQLFEQEVFEWVVSQEILAEYEKALTYTRVREIHKLTDQQITQTIEDVRTFATLVEVTVSFAIVSDPDDNKFFECAFEGGAEFVISGDAKVLAVKEYQGIKAFSPALLLSLLEQID